jgi:hypothetical protein
MSFNDCITQDDQNELFAIRGGLDSLQWRVGDIANRNYEQVKDKYSFSFVCAAAGYYAGKSGSTIQRWAHAAAFYPEVWREKYGGLLSLEHYITAMRFDDWAERLERAAYGGRNEEPQSVDQMNAISLSNTPEEPDNFSIAPDAVVSYENNVPTVQILGKPDNAIQTILGLISRLADSLGLNEERRGRVNYALELLREALNDSVQVR